MLDLATVKAYLRVTNDSEDAVIGILLASAIAQVEKLTGHLLEPAEVIEPVASRRLMPSGIRLFKSPVTEITAISYPGGPDGTPVSIGDWQLVEGAHPALLPAWGQAWPALATGEVLTVTYTAGFPADEVPGELEAAVLTLVAHAFHHRGDDAAKSPDLDPLIGAYRPLGIA